MRLLGLILEVVLILLRWYADPDRAASAVRERLEREQQSRRERFREALAKKDADTVSGMLSDLRDRVRHEDGVSDGK